MKELTSSERVRKALNREEVDRIPVTSPCQCGLLDNMKTTNCFWPDAHRDAQKMAILGAACHELQGIESVRVPFCITVAAEACGTGIKWPTRPDVQPMAIDFVIKKPGDLDKVKVPDPMKDGRMPAVMEALGILNRKYGNTLPIFCEHEGPYTLCSVLRGLENLAMDQITNKDFVKGLLDYALQVLETYVTAQVAHGATAVFQTDGVASGDVMSPKTYEAQVFETNKALMKYFAGHLNGVPFVHHVCGKSSELVSLVTEVQAQYLPNPIATSYETVVPIPHVKNVIGNRKIAVYGEINVNQELLFGPVEAIDAQVKLHIEQGSDMIGPCCGMGSRTPSAHVKAMVDATHKYGERK
ncbi:MAG: uroporphyrinogen decarboxylase family protein [Methanomassiliicoccales archaeon]